MTDPIAIITAVNASIELIKVLLPEVSAMVSSGQVSNEAQQKVLDGLNALRGPGKFEGPEWEIAGSGAPPIKPQ